MVTTKRMLKNAMYEQFAVVGKALSSPKRLEILYLLSQSPKTVEELARGTALSAANTSQHLQRLKRARLVREAREGVHIRYSVADPAVTKLWIELRTVARKQLAEVERALDDYRHRRHRLEKISIDQLQDRLQNDSVILLDVRPQEEYAAGHLPGAISIPLYELKRRAGELPRDKAIVAYCRGPYCILGDEAIELLAELGRSAARLDEGAVEWQLYGLELAN